MLTRLEEELALKEALINSIAARDKSKLSPLITQAQKMNFSGNEVSQAIALVQRLDQEENMIRTLKEAMTREHLDDLNKVIDLLLS
jgi:hypothetical protein